MTLWDSPPHHPDMRCLDVAGVGRYLVRRECKGSRRWVVLLNGKATVYDGRSREEAMKAVERIVAQRELSQ